MTTAQSVYSTISGVSRAAMLVDLNIRTYSGRRQDKSTQKEIVAAKGAHSKRAASVYKNLFSECVELEAIIKFQARVRAEHYRLTLPWSDNGTRLLPSRLLLDYQQTMNRYGEEFDLLVEKFLDKYDTLVGAAAFELGALFDRSEYLLREQVERRFSFETTVIPMPTAGDFRLDIESEIQQDLIAKYETKTHDMLAAANREAWERLHGVLTRLSERLSLDATGKKRTFHDTMVTNAEELCGLLTSLNVARDADLERARVRLEEALLGVTPQALREEEITRDDMKRKVDAILSEQFGWLEMGNTENGGEE